MDEKDKSSENWPLTRMLWTAGGGRPRAAPTPAISWVLSLMTVCCHSTVRAAGVCEAWLCLAVSGLVVHCPRKRVLGLF